MSKKEARSLFRFLKLVILPSSWSRLHCLNRENKSYDCCFFKRRRGNALCTEFGTCEDGAYPLNLSSSQATRSHWGNTRSYEPKTMNETMLFIKKKVSLFRRPGTGDHKFPPPFQRKRMRTWEKKEDSHREQEKKKKQEES